MDVTGGNGVHTEALVRELRCLLSISSMLSDDAMPVREIMDRIVVLIPAAYSFPEIARVRVTWTDIAAETPGFRATRWEQSAAVFARSRPVGLVQVCYLEERPQQSEGPFLEEERELINAVAELMGERIDKERIASELRLHEERLRTVLKSAPIILWAADNEARITLARGRMLGRLGLTPEDVVGKPVESILERRPETASYVQRALSGEDLTVDIDARGLTFQSRFSPIIDASGAVEGITGVLTDISGRVAAEAESKRMSRVLEEIVSGTGFFIVFLDAHLRILRVNRAFAEVMGKDSAVFRGMDFAALMRQSELAALLHEAARVKKPRSASEMAFGLTGESEGGTAYLDVDILPLEAHGETDDALVVILVDRTLRKRAVLDLEKLAGYLQDVREEERRHIAREIHDELGGLLTALKMEMSFPADASASGAAFPPAAPKGAGLLIDKAIAMVRNLAASLRPQALDDFGLIVAVEDLVDQFRKRAKIRCELAASVDAAEVRKDMATAVFRILQEALTNVSRHSKATRVTVSLSREADDLLLRIEDNGRGMPRELPADVRTFGILGMRERVGHFGGTMSVGGGRNKGTVICVRLPLGEE